MKMTRNSFIEWSSISDWGFDAGKGAGTCAGCDTCRVDNKFYRIYVDGQNVSSRCVEAGGGDKLIFPSGEKLTCTFNSIAGWEGENKTFVIKAHNGCCDQSGKPSCPSIQRTFKINTPPEIISFSPTSGLSGNEPDEDSGSLCDDHNPQEFTAVYEDIDGCDDMTFYGLWIDDESPHVKNTSDSLHAGLKSGSDIRILAEGTSVGGTYPIMELRINEVPVKYFVNIGSYNLYDYRHDEPVSADEIKIRFLNDRCAGTEDRNLKIDKIILDGVIYETEENATSNDCCPNVYGVKDTLCCQNGYFQYHGSSKIPIGKRFYGYEYIDQGFNCSGGSTKCWKNFTWFGPNSGYAVGIDASKICSPQSGIYDDQFGSVCDENNNVNHENTSIAWNVTSATCNGNRLTVKWKVWVYDYLDSMLSNYDIYSVVIDKMGDRNKKSAGSSEVGWADVADRQLDLEPPKTTLKIVRQSGDVADSLHFKQWADDDRPADSGLKIIFDRYYKKNGAQFKIGDPITVSPAGSALWGEQDDFITGFEGGDVVTGKISAQDVACNLSSDPASVGPPIGHEWMLTKFYDTYAALGYNNPMQIGVPFSTYWVGGNVNSAPGSWNFGAGVPSLNDWQSQGYNDSNRGIDWYDRLYGLAIRSEWAVENEIVDITSSVGATIDQSFLPVDGIYIYTSSTELTITGNCLGRKILFVSNADVKIVPDISITRPEYVCLLITKNNITIVPGADAVNAENEDIIEAAFITNGTFTSEWDPKFDRLKIRGFVFADKTVFERDLVFEKNFEFPAEKIVYDPRYIYLLRDMLGRRSFSQFECGIVTDSGFCTGW